MRAKLPAGYRIDTGGAVEQSAKANLSIQKLQPVMVAAAGGGSGHHPAAGGREAGAL
jgi:hypothetical protein